jgi:predicted AAA+ superfamily ATPase
LLASILTAKVPEVFTRAYSLPKGSFFLFGPRATGKTTWLRSVLPSALWIDLLRLQEVLALTRQPDLFRSRVEALPAGSWVVIDEIQRLPQLLDEVHSLIATHPGRFRFAMLGSSARKLRRLDVNLLAGRAIRREFFPLTGREMDYDFALAELLAFGTLPAIRTDVRHAVDVLDAYASTYLREEIQQESLIRDLPSFSRFLEVAALANGQVTSVASIARDAGVARPTVQRYFDVLVDTLIGLWVRPWKASARVKEVGHPRFYFFDTGVVRALRGATREPLERAEGGPLLETLVLHELRAHMAIAGTGGEITYWGTPSGGEIDFIWRRGKRAVGIEVKASNRYRSEDAATLREFLQRKLLGSAYVVYDGRDVLQDGGITVLPVAELMRRLARGDVIAS